MTTLAKLAHLVAALCTRRAPEHAFTSVVRVLCRHYMYATTLGG